MNQEIKSFQKTIEHSNLIIKKLMDTQEFVDRNHAFVVLKATMKAIRDRLAPGEVFHLGGQLPALLRGYYFEDYDYGNLLNQKDKIRGVNEFFGRVQDYLKAYDFLDIDRVVPLAMNILLDSIDQGEANQVVNQLPKEVKEIRQSYQQRSFL